MRRPVVPGLTGGVALVALGLAGAAGCAITRTLTAPYSGRRYSTQILNVSTHGDLSMVQLANTAQTRQSGRFGAFLQDGRHIKFGTTPISTGGGITRSVSAADADALAGVEHVSWTGIEFANPNDAGLQAVDVEIPTEHGSNPAWVVGDPARATWAVHVHGLGSTRAGTLRGVQVASELGFTSLVTTYQNSAEGPAVGSRRSMLGLDESDDVEHALEYAVAHGAERIVMFGWSMGANIALTMAEKSRWRRRIVAIVAESPVLDWRATLRSNLAGLGLPAWMTCLALPWLMNPVLARCSGLDHAIDLDALDWTPQDRIETPTLILQGRCDRSAPWQLAEHVAAQNPRVHLELFDADHTTTWNSDPERWRSTVADWVTTRLGGPADPRMS